jgi:hypothetical protein
MYVDKLLYIYVAYSCTESTLFYVPLTQKCLTILVHLVLNYLLCCLFFVNILALNKCFLTKMPILNLKYITEQSVLLDVSNHL